MCGLDNIHIVFVQHDYRVIVLIHHGQRVAWSDVDAK